MLASKSKYPHKQKCKICSKKSDENEGYGYGCGCYFCNNCLLELNEKKVKTYADKNKCPNQHLIENIVNKILNEKKENEKKIKVLSEKINDKLTSFEDSCTNCEDIVKTNFEFMRQEIEIGYESALNKLSEWKESYIAKINKFEDESVNNLKQKDKRDLFNKYIKETKANVNAIASDKFLPANVSKLEEIDKVLDEKRDSFKYFMYADKTIEFKAPSVDVDPSISLIIGRLVTQFRTGKHGFDCTTIESENLKELYEFPLLSAAVIKAHYDNINKEESEDENGSSNDNDYDEDEDNEGDDEDDDNDDDDDDDDDDEAGTEEDNNEDDDDERVIDLHRPFARPVIKISPICNDKLFICINNMGAVYNLSGETNKQSKCGTSVIATQEDKIYMIKDSGLFHFSKNFEFHGFNSLAILKRTEVNAITCSDDFVYITTTYHKKVNERDDSYEAVIEIRIYSTSRGLSIVGDLTKKRAIVRFIDHEKVEGDYMLRDYEYPPDLAGKNGKLYAWYAQDHDLDIVDEKTFKLMASVKTPKIESFNFNIMFELGAHNTKIVVDNEDLIIIREKHVLMFCKIENKELKLLKQVEFYDFADFCVTNNGRLAVLDNKLNVKIY